MHHHAASRSISPIFTRSTLTHGALIAAACLSAHASAQCWAPGIGNTGMNGDVNASIQWDSDGAGPNPTALYAAGGFTTAGGVSTNRIARWVSSGTWAALGTGVSGSVQALAVVPGGDLVAGGGFTTAGGVTVNRVARWNGSAWSGFGTGMDDLVNAVAVRNGEIIAAGRFTTAGGTPVNRIARWDGSAWQPLGAGVGGTPPFYINALHVSTNNDLYVGGFFSTAGGNPASNIARWNGSAWSALAGGINGPVNAIITMPNGDIIAGGQFTNPGPGGVFQNHIARWNGTAWSNLGTGMNTTGGNLVWSLAVLNTGDLAAGGIFTSAGGVSTNYYARWNGTAWFGTGSALNGSVRTLTALNDGTLAMGGTFTLVTGSTVGRIARYAYGTVAPDVTVDPQSTEACPGSPAQFHATGVGSPPIFHRWQWRPLPTDAWTNLVEGVNTAPSGQITATNTQTPTLTVVSNGMTPSFRLNLSSSCSFDVSAAAALSIAAPCCDSTDFNGDGLFPDTADIDDFLSVFSGGPCSTGTCGDTDFNNDGLFPDTLDIDSLLSVFSGGACL